MPIHSGILLAKIRELDQRMEQLMNTKFDKEKAIW